MLRLLRLQIMLLRHDHGLPAILLTLSRRLLLLFHDLLPQTEAPLGVARHRIDTLVENFLIVLCHLRIRILQFIIAPLEEA